VITQIFSDDVPVNTQELADAMRVSRWTISRWKKEGYVFEFRTRTTPGHLKQWLRSQKVKQPAVDDDKEQTRLASALDRLR
jgi:hypothetical protein